MKSELMLQPHFAEDRINENIYGHFAEHLGRCIYEGIWVGEDSTIPNTGGIRNDVVQALREIEIPVLRWPGGCFADEYHWKDGVGPRDERKRTVNTHWGEVIEPHQFGTHEFFKLCDLIGAKPYICGNVGSGTPREMADWIEYITFSGDSSLARQRRKNGREEPWELPYFGVGNENWGCGGEMRAEYYADLYRRYGTYVRQFGESDIYKIACGASGDDYHWTQVLMERAAARMDGLSLHYYTTPRDDWESKGAATGFSEKEWFTTLKATLFMEDLLKKHGTIMDRYDPKKRVGLIVDEWGAWYDVEPGTEPGFLYQQNTLRDALVAGINLNIFNNHADRVEMANIAQTVNVLQAPLLTREEELILTPTYHVFKLFTKHQGNRLVPLQLRTDNYNWGDEAIPALNASASVDEEGTVFLTLCNLAPEEETEVNVGFGGKDIGELSAEALTAGEMDAHNTFEEPERIKPVEFENMKVMESDLNISLPPKSVVVVEVA